MSTTDRYGLPLSTSSAAAAGHYQAGMDRLLAYGYGADQSFAAAVAADGEFALAHAGAALFALFQGDGAAAKAAVERARGLVAGATRRERQQVEALAAVAGGEAARGLALIGARARVPARRAAGPPGRQHDRSRRAHRPRGTPRRVRRTAGARVRRRLVVPVRAGVH